jgi:hypothetical protein
MNAYRILVGKLLAKRPVGTPRRRWEDIIEMNRREVNRTDPESCPLPGFGIRGAESTVAVFVIR